MSQLKEKLHLLIDETNDPIVLENLYQYLNIGIEKRKTDILDELSPTDMNSLNESLSEYMRGELLPHKVVVSQIIDSRQRSF